MRVKTADGKYCYSGPNCKWHSANGISAARRELRTAERELASAQTFDELVAAKNRQAEAIKVYDTTSEGLAELEKQVTSATDEVDKKYLEARLEAAQIQAAQIEADAQKEWEAAEAGFATGSIALSDNHTYDAPTFKVVGDDIYAPTVGSKYTGYRPSSEIAKNVRADLKEAQAKGYLPKHLTFSVTSDTYSGGQAVRVEIRGVTDDQQFSGENLGGRFGDLTPEVVELRKRVDGIASAYNSQCIRGEIDYFQSMYYANISVESNHGRQWREKEAAVAKEKRATAPIKKNLIATYDKTNQEKFVKDNNIKFANTTKDGVNFGQIEGTSFYAFEYPSRMNPGTSLIRVYDFTGLSTSNNQSITEALKDYEGNRLDKRFRRNRFI